MGTGTAWAYSMVVVLAPEMIPTAVRGLYFEATAMIVAIVWWFWVAGRR